MSVLAIALALQSFGAEGSPLPPVSPSIEHDADYLMTTRDFSSAQFGMALEWVRESERGITVRTTGAEFAFEPAAGTLKLRQRIGKARQVATVTFPPTALTGLKVDWHSDGAVMLSAHRGRLQMRINGDSLLMIRYARALELSYALGFSPATIRQSSGNMLLLDEYGGIGSYLATGSGPGCVPGDDGRITCSLAPEQVLWVSVAPPRKYPWEASLSDRVCWHWSMKTGYPTDAQIERWCRYGNILLQQSEVMLWKDWSLRFIPRNGVGEFERVNRTCERLGMRNIVYTSPYYFLTGTGLEDKAMNSFDNFAVTGFSPGDGRGLNWPIFVQEIAKVMREYRPDGLYFDGIYDNVVRTYIVSRKAREIVGEGGLLEYHATGSPPGGGVYLPQIDTYFDYILRGEGVQAEYTNPDYLRYFVSTYHISNSIGVLCNNNDYPLDQAFVDSLLDRNIRLHYLLGGPRDQRTQAMRKWYWPALDERLKGRVERAAARRQAAGAGIWEAMRSAREGGEAGLSEVWAANLADPGFVAALGGLGPGEHELPGGWRAYLSPRSDAALSSEGGVLHIDALAHTVACLEHDLPGDVAAVQLRIRATGECGMSWGPAILFRAGNRIFRFGLRSDGKAQGDRPGSQLLFDGYPLGTWFWLRVRLAEGCVVLESSSEGSVWRPVHVEYVGPTDGPRSLAVGKVPYDGSRVEFQEPGGRGQCEFADVRALRGSRP